MSSKVQATEEELDNILSFYNRWLDDEIAELAQDSEREILRVPYPKLQTFDSDLADSWFEAPEVAQVEFEAALQRFSLPIDANFEEASVALVDLPAYHTYYPGEFSPTEAGGQYVAVRGEVSKATEVYSRIETAYFRCERCEVGQRIPQNDKDELQEPHECRSCERKGPFSVDKEQSEMVDAQSLRIQTPPEVSGGNGQNIDVYVEGTLTDVATVGDRVTIPSKVRLDTVTNGSSATAKLEPWLFGYDIELEDAEQTDIDIEPSERERIQELAGGEEGDPLDVAADSLAPKIYGYDRIKRMAILLAVGGSKTVYPDGSSDRGDFHMLLLGDPGTSKSKILERVEEIVPRSVGVSGADATGSGITTAATQDDFGDGEWTLEAGAFVQANDGVVCVDELDDMDPDIRSDMLEPMSKQSIHVSKAGINAKLSTEAAVLAAGNPKYGRYDPHEEISEQFDMNSALLSRFDLIYCPQDKPDPETDAEIAQHILQARDAAKRIERGEDVTQEDRESVETTVEEEILRKWIALARQQPKPVFESEDLRQEIADGFQTLRAANGYNDNAPVPVTFRKLEGLVRIAEAAAKFELSDTIEKRHTEIAMQHVGESMKDYQRNEDGELDADIQETGQSRTQQERYRLIQETVLDKQPNDGTGVPIDDVVDELGIGRSRIEFAIEEAKDKGIAIEKNDGENVRWIDEAW